VKWENGKLSLDSEGAPLSEVLQAVSHETGIEITGSEGLSDPVSTHFAGMDLLQALQELLSYVDHAIAAAPPSSAAPREIRVIIIKRPAADSVRAASVAKTKTDATVPDAEAVIQVAATTTHESDPEASALAEIQAAASPENTDAPAIDEALPGAEPLQDAAQTEKLAAVEAASTGQDWETLGKYMQDSDAAVLAAAFDALAAHDTPVAIEKLLADIQDAGQRNRLPALQLLVQSPQADEQIVMATLIDALQGADSSLSSYAAQALAARGTATATNALGEMLSSSEASTRLMILESVTQTEAGLPLLRMALSDSSETVRSVAEDLLQQAEASKKP
jgi:hypothetical protein